MKLIQDYNTRIQSLKTVRSNFEPVWKDLTDYILPSSGRFQITDKNKGNRQNSKIIDSTPVYSVRTLAAGMMAGITNPARPWFNLRVLDPDLNSRRPVREWLDTVRGMMGELFISSNLYNVLPTLYEECGVFGIGSFIIMENKKKLMRCFSYPIGSYHLGASWEGMIDSCYREFQMSASQIVSQFGYENCSLEVQRAATTAGMKDQNFTVIYAIEPNDEWDKNSYQSKYKQFKAVYYEQASRENKFLKESGFDEFPVMAPRWKLTGEDTYGYGPGWDALGEIRALMKEQDRKLRIIDKGNSPSLIGPGTARNANISQLPGAISFIDAPQGGQKIEPLYMPDPRWLQYLREDIAETQQRIKKAFFEDLFLLIASEERSGVTAFEIAARKEEKLLILGPVLTRLNDELLDPLIDRTFNIMARAGILPPAPPEIQGQDLTVEYISTMAQAMKLTGISGVERLAAFTTQIAQIKPTVLDLFDADEAVTTMADMLGTPPKLLNNEKEVNSIRAQRNRQESMASSAAMANSMADTTQKLSSAQMTEPSALSGLLASLQNQGGAAGPGGPETLSSLGQLGGALNLGANQGAA